MSVFDMLRRMAPIRQVEAAELMIGQNNYTAMFAKVLLAITPEKLLVVLRRKKVDSVTAEQIARMEREFLSLQTQVKSVEDSYGLDNFQLTVTCGYMRTLLANGRIVRWLTQHRPEYLSEFQSIAGIESFGDAKSATE